MDVVQDETYSMDPPAYDLNSFLAQFSITPAQAAALPWLSGAAAPRVFRQDGRLSAADMGSDWFEGAMVRPGDVLQDMVRALHPEQAKVGGGAGAGAGAGGGPPWPQQPAAGPAGFRPGSGRCQRVESEGSERMAGLGPPAVVHLW